MAFLWTFVFTSTNFPFILILVKSFALYTNWLVSLSWEYWSLQNQHSISVLRKRCSTSIKQTYRRNPLLCNFIEITLRHGCSPVNLFHIVKAFAMKTFRGLLLLLKMWVLESLGALDWDLIRASRKVSVTVINKTN